MGSVWNGPEISTIVDGVYSGAKGSGEGVVRIFLPSGQGMYGSETASLNPNARTLAGTAPCSLRSHFFRSEAFKPGNDPRVQEQRQTETQRGIGRVRNDESQVGIRGELRPR